MKKGKIFLLSLLVLAFAGVLSGCGREGEEENGSNTDTGNGFTQNTTEGTTTDGVIEEIVTDAATGAKEILTDAWDAVTGAADDLGNDVHNVTAGATNAVR